MRKLLLILCILTVAACANQDVFKDTFDNEKTWAELQTQLPTYPHQDKLFQFDVGSADNNFQHYVDTTSIKVGKDGVIRYSLVVKSSVGATNISFEGMRCATNERKLYALGRSESTWSESRISEWQPLENVAQLYAQRQLFNYYFCPNKSIVRNSKEAISALKAGIHPRVIR